MRKIILSVALSMIVVAMLFSCHSNDSSGSSGLQAKVDELQKRLAQYEAKDKLTEIRLVRFDSLDFDIYSHAKWDLLQISHDANIVVTYPDGHQTKDIDTHIKELQPQFVFAPDTKISAHPVKFGSGDWTCVIGTMEGTFSKPMPLGNGKTIPPTGKKFRLQMCTVGHWNAGKMVEEYLFWDNMAFMKQVGLAN